MNVVVPALLALLAQVAPSLGTPAVTTVITALIQLLPTLVQLGEDLAPIVKNIIAALSANPATTAEQLDRLQRLDTQIDAAFEAAATIAEAEDAQGTTVS
jgi:hypothetical protein